MGGAKSFQQVDRSKNVTAKSSDWITVALANLRLRSHVQHDLWLESFADRGYRRRVAQIGSLSEDGNAPFDHLP